VKLKKLMAEQFEADGGDGASARRWARS